MYLACRQRGRHHCRSHVLLPVARLLIPFPCLLLPLCAAAGYLPSWYRCTCPANTAATGCVCPSLDPPGGLARADTPQFILFSHDDAITEETHSGLRSIFEHGQAACRPVATLFTLARATSESGGSGRCRARPAAPANHLHCCNKVSWPLPLPTCSPTCRLLAAATAVQQWL